MVDVFGMQHTRVLVYIPKPGVVGADIANYLLLPGSDADVLHAHQALRDGVGLRGCQIVGQHPPLL